MEKFYNTNKYHSDFIFYYVEYSFSLFSLFFYSVLHFSNKLIYILLLKTKFFSQTKIINYVLNYNFSLYNFNSKLFLFFIGKVCLNRGYYIENIEFNKINSLSYVFYYDDRKLVRR